MIRIRLSACLALITLVAPSLSCRAQKALPDGFHKLALPVDGVQRGGFVYAPASAKEKPTPVVFVFHGHGGTAMAAGRSFAMHKHWPEALK